MTETTQAPPPSGVREAPAAGRLERARAHPAWRWLLLLVAAGIALRALTLLLYSTVVTDYYTGDAGRFIRAGYPGIFEDEWQPAIYPLLLAGVRSVVDELAVTIALQHALGVGAGLLLYAAARRAGAGPLPALVPAGLVLLSGDHLFLEHTFLSEALWIPVLALGTYAAVRAVTARSLRWLAVAGAVFGLSAVVRNVSIAIPVVLALWAAWSFRGAWSDRLRAAGAALGPAVAVIGIYVVVANVAGTYTGLGEMSGWSLYQRVGQFADCRQFEPPPRTRGLCDSRPVAERPGPFYWYFEVDSPARTAFPAMSPEDSDEAGRFARAAILAQPLDYARTVTKDLVRYLDPDAGFDRPFSGSPPEAMTFRTASPDPANTVAFAERVRTKYDGVDPTPDAGSTLLETYHSVFRLNPLLLLALLVLAIAGAVRGRGAARAVSVLCLAVAAVLLLMPPALSSYDARYAVPPAALLAVAAALGLTRPAASLPSSSTWRSTT